MKESGGTLPKNNRSTKLDGKVLKHALPMKTIEDPSSKTSSMNFTINTAILYL